MSASEDLSELNNQYRIIDLSKVRKRWFRNWYVLVQVKGYFDQNGWVFNSVEATENKMKYDGSWYGPFWSKEEAEQFRQKILGVWYSCMFS